MAWNYGQRFVDVINSSNPLGEVFNVPKTLSAVGKDIGQVGQWFIDGLSGNVNDPTTTKDGKTYADFDGDWLTFLKQKASEGDEASLDRLMNYLMQEQSNTNARNWTANREDTAIQRFASDARAAGFNPQALLMQGGSPIASSSSGASYSGNSYLSSQRYSNQNRIQWASLILGFTASIFKTTISAISSLAKGGESAAGSLGSAAIGAAAAL